MDGYCRLQEINSLHRTRNFAFRAYMTDSKRRSSQLSVRDATARITHESKWMHCVILLLWNQGIEFENAICDTICTNNEQIEIEKVGTNRISTFQHPINIWQFRFPFLLIEILNTALFTIKKTICNCKCISSGLMDNKRFRNALPTTWSVLVFDHQIYGQ